MCRHKYWIGLPRVRVSMAHRQIVLIRTKTPSNMRDFTRLPIEILSISRLFLSKSCLKTRSKLAKVGENCTHLCVSRPDLDSRAFSVMVLSVLAQAQPIVTCDNFQLKGKVKLT